MLRGVFDAAQRGTKMNVGAMGAELIANHACAGFVIGARRVDGRDADETGREVDDLIARTIDLGDDAIDSGALHIVNPI
jgi:hypothetical protein